jgi:hypothetical protein
VEPLETSPGPRAPGGQFSSNQARVSSRKLCNSDTVDSLLTIYLVVLNAKSGVERDTTKKEGCRHDA